MFPSTAISSSFRFYPEFHCIESRMVVLRATQLLPVTNVETLFRLRGFNVKNGNQNDED